MAFSRVLETAAKSQAAAGVKHSQWHVWQAKGLMVRAVAIGPRCKRYPANEVQAVIDARIRGESEEQIRRLVAKLHEDRALLLEAA